MKIKNVMFQEQQEPYKYQRQRDNKTAVVFIRKFIEEKKEIDENGNETILFIYDQNEFVVNINEITEEMIAENPMNYFDYPPKKGNVTLEERISDLEALWLDEILGGDEDEN